jgi:hypothetical protein
MTQSRLTGKANHLILRLIQIYSSYHMTRDPLSCSCHVVRGTLWNSFIHHKGRGQKYRRINSARFLCTNLRLVADSIWRSPVYWMQGPRTNAIEASADVWILFPALLTHNSTSHARILICLFRDHYNVPLAISQPRGFDIGTPSPTTF